MGSVGEAVSIRYGGGGRDAFGSVPGAVAVARVSLNVRPDYSAACPSCSATADGFNGIAVHLANHDVMLWAVSRAPLSKLQAFKKRMGWTFPWA
jgi:hypothetical protein